MSGANSIKIDKHKVNLAVRKATVDTKLMFNKNANKNSKDFVHSNLLNAILIGKLKLEERDKPPYDYNRICRNAFRRGRCVRLTGFIWLP